MDKKNIIKWSFWPILIAILFIGYLFINKQPVSKHVNYIPANAKAVVIIDSKLLAKDYFELLRFNPKKIDEVFPPGEMSEELVLPSEMPGIVPLEKMVFYIFQDLETKKEQFFRCFIVTLDDKSQFLKKMNGMREKPVIKEFEDGQVYHYKEDNKLVLCKNDIAVVVEPINPAFKTSIDIGERHFSSVFSDNDANLISESNSFSETLMEKNQMQIWSASGEGILEGFGGNMIGIDKMFNSHVLSINLNEKSIKTDVHLFLNEEGFLVENKNETITLSDPELLRLSMSLNPEKFGDYFKNILPDEKSFLTEKWTGNICTSIIGFKNKPVFQLSEDTIIDSNKDTIIKADTIEVSRLLNLPNFVLSVEINNEKQIQNLLDSDSIFETDEFGNFVYLPNLINEKMYIKLSGKNLLFCSIPFSFDYYPSYSTFAFSMNIEELINNYPPKDMIQALVIPTIQKFDLKSFEMYFHEMNNEFVCLNGELKLGEENIHSLLKVVPLAIGMLQDL